MRCRCLRPEAGPLQIISPLGLAAKLVAQVVFFSLVTSESTPKEWVEHIWVEEKWRGRGRGCGGGRAFCSRSAVRRVGSLNLNSSVVPELVLAWVGPGSEAGAEVLKLNLLARGPEMVL